MDAAWTPDGYSLLLASYDGTVAVCRFEEKELGEAWCTALAVGQGSEESRDLGWNVIQTSVFASHS